MTPLLLALALSAAIRIPLVKGLSITGAASERQGDYESQILVDSIDGDGTLHLSTSAQVPDKGGGPPTLVAINRIVHADDLKDGREYRYLFSSSGQEEFPGATALGTSAAVLADLASKGEASIKLDGEAGGLADMMSGMLGALGAGTAKAGDGYLTATGVVKLAAPKPISYTVLVNNQIVALPAWHVTGRFGEPAVDVDWLILADESNPLSLRFAFGKDKLEIVRIDFPSEDASRVLQAALESKKCAPLYGIYFDFNQATIKPQSDAVLRTIVGVMNGNPGWRLLIEGHTDNIGGDEKNKVLSTRRAGAVKDALVERGVAEGRLKTAGYGRSVPRESNATLAGRARNRRVELCRP